MIVKSEKAQRIGREIEREAQMEILSETLSHHKNSPTNSTLAGTTTENLTDTSIDFGGTMSSFEQRHIGPNIIEQNAMLKEIGYPDLETLTNTAVPKAIQLKKSLDLPNARTEEQALSDLLTMMNKNQVFRSFIGQGYYDTLTPQVIKRNILENPGWYTQYTPYQAEIAQGRLEALLNFQTMVTDLTGMEVANASMLDEATSAAEAMSMAFNLVGDDKKNLFFVSDLCHPQTIEVIETRAEPIGIKVVRGTHTTFQMTDEYFGAIFQYPATDGSLYDYDEIIKKVQSKGALAIVAADLLALTLLKSPGAMGADMAVGNTQRFGVPMGFGGPHAAYMATRQKFVRSMPGRLVGVSVDAQGRPAFRLTLQTREQHIRREKATSNICTAQVLLAIMASMYAVYHGPEGLKRIASKTSKLANIFKNSLKKAGFEVNSTSVFDTVTVQSGAKTKAIYEAAINKGINLRIASNSALSVSFDESKSEIDLNDVLGLFGVTASSPATLDFGQLNRQGDILTHEVFRRYHSETEMLRYITRLQSRDLSLAHSMIALGSCTMKLNATSEMVPVTWPQVGGIHPFAPKDQTTGYYEMFQQLESWLSEITGFAGVSLQPNAGSQGEYAGLLVIRKYHQSRGESHRNVCLIPSSAHGTNPASAVMAGMKVVVVACDAQGNVDLNDLKAKAEAHSAQLSALMVTYPSTHGVFEEEIKQICDIVHNNGGQVYMDGANMNAQVGLCRPGDFGPDVCHLNLHKTFCIPHGGGGPGMGPIGVAKHLVPHLPGHRSYGIGNDKNSGAVSATPWGSASILPISWMYVAMMGPQGLKHATQVAILNANYIAKKLDAYFPVLYKGNKGLVAHECIVDLRMIQEKTGVTVEDVAKRLMDYNYHAPTMSWPVIGTMMIEPTESESKAEIDRFCEAMTSIAAEIKDVLDGKADRANNLLKHAPHSANVVMSDSWDRPYTREKAVFPLNWVRASKFWPAVARINNPHGDKNLVCICPPLESYN